MYLMKIKTYKTGFYWFFFFFKSELTNFKYKMIKMREFSLYIRIFSLKQRCNHMNNKIICIILCVNNNASSYDGY